MIAALDSIPPLTPAEYLAWEEQQELRYEYADGQIYAMTGAMNAIAGKLFPMNPLRLWS